MIKLKDLLNEQSVEVGSAYDNNKQIELVIDRFSSGKWKVIDFDLVQNFYAGGGTSPENILKKQKKVKLKPSQINKIKKKTFTQDLYDKFISNVLYNCLICIRSIELVIITICIAMPPYEIDILCWPCSKTRELTY